MDQPIDPAVGETIWAAVQSVWDAAQDFDGSTEMPQVRAEKVLGRKTSVKILYFTQLLGMALGLSSRNVGVYENLSDSSALLRARGLG